MSKPRRGYHVHLANAYSIALADTRNSVKAAFSNGAVNFADGKPLSWYSLLRRHDPQIRQVRGPQLFRDVFDHGRHVGARHFLLGSTDETLGLLRDSLERGYPGVQIVGVLSPPFRPQSTTEIFEQDRRIRDSGAHIVWVGLGTPKQDIEAARLAATHPVVVVAIGAAFDFVAGTANEAPEWVGKVGFEWLYRFAKEPKRLWRRYLIGNLQFLWAVQKYWFRK